MRPISCSILETLGFRDATFPRFASSSLTFQSEILFHYPPIIWCCQGWTKNHCCKCSLGYSSASTLFYLGDICLQMICKYLFSRPDDSLSLHTHIKLIADIFTNAPDIFNSKCVQIWTHLQCSTAFPAIFFLNQARKLGINFDFFHSLTSNH